MGQAGATPWEDHADWWQREFTDGADPEYEEQILPIVERHLAGAARVLDVGCGEGQVGRRLASIGADVVGVDPTVAQLVTAKARAGGPHYARSWAEQLPIASASFDAVVMCLVLEHVDPIEPVIEEVARVLRPRGTFLLLLNHPILQAPGSGWIDDQIVGEQYWRVGAYLRTEIALEELGAGVCLPFVHRPFSEYIHALGANGLLVDDMEEPPPPAGFLARAAEYVEAASIPRLMVVRSKKSEAGVPPSR